MLGRFNLGYFLKGGGKEDWFKSWGLGWRLILTLAVLFFVGIIIYRAFFMKNTTVNVGKGGTANIYQARKRFFIPFIEGSVGQSNRYKMETAIKGGLRFEF